MTNAGTFQVSTPSEREIVMTRVFDAPRNLVFDAHTKPELLTRWLGVRGGWTFPVCQVDLKVGGRYHFEWESADAKERFGFTGTYREIKRPERIVNTESLDGNPGETLNTLVLVERDGKTTLTVTMVCPSQEVRDAIIATGMAKGVAESYENLDGVLASLGAGTSFARS